MEGSSRRSLAILAGLLVLVGLVGGGLWGLILSGDGEDEPTGAGRTVEVEIPEGASTDEVAEILADAGVVEREWAFRLGAFFDGRSTRIRPGAYELREGMATGEVLEVLVDGPPPPETFSFTVPEGLTVDETFARIAEAEGSPFDVEDLEGALNGVALPDWVPLEDLPEGAQPYEGLLFPATYEHFVDADAQQVLAEMVSRTGDELDRLDVGDDRDEEDAEDGDGGWSRYELLIVGSLIEREVRLAEERDLVAGVVANRLEDGMRLQIDATVQYAQGEHRDRLLFEDLEIDSAWNTYDVEGLPPTPIAAPGRAALEAAAEPADTDYRFYVVCDTETGEHAFAESDAEHQQNVARYREIQDEGGRVCE